MSHFCPLSWQNQKKVANTNNYLEQCSIGLFIKSDCHSTTYTKKKDILIVSRLSDRQKELLFWRILGLTLTADSTICFHHYFYYTRYCYILGFPGNATMKQALPRNNETRFHATMKQTCPQQCKRRRYYGNGEAIEEREFSREQLESCSETRIDRTHPLCSECNLGVVLENQ
jgi:hypothetical protein